MIGGWFLLWSLFCFLFFFFFLWRTQFTETSPHILLTLHRVRKCHHESLDQTLTDVSQKERDLLYQQFVQCGSGAQLSWTSAARQVLSLKKGPNLPGRWCLCFPLLPNNAPPPTLSKHITSGCACIHQVVRWRPFLVLIQPSRGSLTYTDGGDSVVLTS